MIKVPTGPTGQNNLIHTLSQADRALIDPYLKPVKMEKRMVLEEPNEPVDQVYFPKSGVGSTVAVNNHGRQVEVGLFGYEGMSGLSVVMQTGHSANETFMQIGGEGLCMDSNRLHDLLEKNASLQRHFLRYVQALMTQISQTALSNAKSKLEERLARWILMCHDRIRHNGMALTHEFLSIMLGVRRAGVTVGTHILEGNGLIRAERGVITVLDRDGLVNLAQGSYGIPEAEYARLIGFDQP